MGQSYEDGDTVTYKYDNSGGLASVTDSASGITTKYYYDFTDRLMKYTESGTDFSHSVSYAYDKLNNLTSLTETINGTAATTTYTYDNDNRIRTVTNGDIVETYSYDTYGRVVRQVITRDGETIVTLGFAYKANSDGTPTDRIGRVAVHSSIYDVSYSYLYDANGNIYRVSDGTNAITYVYDTQNQLLRENNPYIGKSFRYFYDDAGNIKMRREYAYTTDTLENPISTVYYSYGDADWGDLLTSYNGQTITYDTIGNPLSDGTWTYTWEHGRELASMANNTVTWSYAYNADGLRTSRSNGTDTYNYIYNGSQLSQMTIGDNVLRFAYDASGLARTVTWNDTVYYYATNLQGDIIAILDADGNAIVEYTYDAWGNIYSVSGSLAETFGVLNPLRYRGYVYDPETELYYLQSRYYNPEIGRFINSDDAEILFENYETPLQYSLYAYCWNNPVNMYDPDGYLTLALAGGGYLAVAGTVGASNAWNPVGWVVLGAVAVTTVVVVGISIYQYSEHKSTKNGKKLNKHQKENARRQRDQGGEKKKLKPDWKKRK